MNRLFPWFCWIFLTICCFGCGDGALEQLRSHGQTAEATVRSLQETTALKAKNRHLSITVAFFAQDSTEIAQSAHQDDVLKDTSMSMADRIEHWQPGGSKIGDYTTAEIEVSRAIFDRYHEGDKVEIVYLPSDPQVVRLKEQL